MKNKTLILIALFMFAFTIMGCENTNSGGRDYACDPVAVWVYKNKNDICNLFFCKNNESIYYFYDYSYFKDCRLDEGFKFEINEILKPFSEWNECNFKMPFDTTKSWLFMFKGKDIPKNISFLFDRKDNIGDTLIFWDSINNVKYYFEKNIKQP